MRTLTGLFSFSIALLFVFGCDLGQEPELKAGVIGTVHGVVSTANTNTRLADIELTWVVNGKSQTMLTDINGFYSIKKLPPGEYGVSISGGGNYANTRVEVFIPTLAMIFPDVEKLPKDEYRVSVVADIELFSLDAGLTGTVYSRQDPENISLAAGVTIIADFAIYNFTPDEYSTVTDANGKFTFTNLPATPTVFLRTLPFNDGIYDYSVQTTIASLLSSGVSDADDMFLSITPSIPFIIQNNYENDDFGVSENIIITFSKAMEIATFRISLVGNTYGEVKFAAKWGNDITLTIDPYVPLQANERYYLELRGKSLDNNIFSDTSISFETQEGIELVYTNLERVDGIFDKFPVSSDIELTFSMEIDLNHYSGFAWLFDESNAIVATTTSLSADSKTLIIDPIYNLENGSDYSLDYRVYSTIEGDYDQYFFNFHSARDFTVPAQVTGFMLDMESGWNADWNTTTIGFKWNSATDADGYAIFAKDNHDNSDFIMVATYSAQDYRTEKNGEVYLYMYPQFDYYADDFIQTPFTAGTELSFQVAAYNDADMGTFSNTVSVADRTGPTISDWFQSESAYNSSLVDTKTITISFSANEYLNPDEINYGTTDEPGTSPYVLPYSAVSFEWDADLRGGEFTIIIPPNSDGSGDTFLITVLEDNSGNQVEEIISIVLF